MGRRGRTADLLSEAGVVVEAAIRELPGELREIAADVPVMLSEEIPAHLIEEGLDPDTLGLFDGGETEGPRGAGSARIHLFLRNILDFAEDDPETFRNEVRVTFLHELGHLIELDEADLDLRGLG